MTQALRPNLFIIGAMKSGTTSLHEYLDTHPQIAMSRGEGARILRRGVGAPQGRGVVPQPVGRAGRRQHRYRGESSTHYTKLPIFQGVPERLFRFNPEARLIYIMRNPFDRVVSHYWHALRRRVPRW